MKHCRRSRTQKKKKKIQIESFQSDGMLYGEVVNFVLFLDFYFVFPFYFLFFKKEAKGTYVGLGYMVLKCVNLSGTGSLFS